MKRDQKVGWGWPNNWRGIKKEGNFQLRMNRRGNVQAAPFISDPGFLVVMMVIITKKCGCRWNTNDDQRLQYALLITDLGILSHPVLAAKSGKSSPHQLENMSIREAHAQAREGLIMKLFCQLLFDFVCLVWQRILIPSWALLKLRRSTSCLLNLGLQHYPAGDAV